MNYTRDDAIFSIGEVATLWRVKSGVIRLDGQGRSDQYPIALAVSGDLLGAECLCGEPYQVKAQALTDVVLELIPVQDEAHRQRLMMEVILQQPTRNHDMTRLRTGPVSGRLEQLFRVMGHPSLAKSIANIGADTLRASLPTLREIALVVDAKPETVCRALTQLLPRPTRKAEVLTSQPFSLAATIPAF